MIVYDVEVAVEIAVVPLNHLNVTVDGAGSLEVSTTDAVPHNDVTPEVTPDPSTGTASEPSSEPNIGV